MLVNPYIWCLLFSGLLSGTLAHYIWQKRTNPAATVFALLMMATTIWSLAYGLELMVERIDLLKLVLQIEYIGIAFAPPLWLLFTLLFTGRERWLRPMRLFILFLAPTFTYLLVISNDLHHFYYYNLTVDWRNAYLLLAITPGPWYSVNIAYAYGTILVGCILLIHAWQHASARYRRQILIMIGGAVFPLLFNSLYLLGVRPFSHIDLTPVGLMATGMLTYLGLFRYSLLDLMPIARASLFERLRDGVVVLDVRRRIVDINQSAQSMLGLTGSALIGFEASQVFQAWPELCTLCNEGGSCCEAIQVTRRPQLALEVCCSRMRDRCNNVMGYVIVIHDVTVRRAVEEALSEREAALREERLLFIGGPTVVFKWRSGADWRVAYVSPNVKAQLGYAPEDFVEGQLPYASLVHPDDLPRVAEEVTSYAAAGVNWFEQEYRLRHSDGNYRWVYDCTSIVRDQSGAALHYQGYVLDITDRKRAEIDRLEMERRVQHAQKLESLGVLAGGIAHDFNNLLTAVLGNLDLARLDLPAESPVVSVIQSAEDATHSAANLTRQLLAYAGRGKFRIEQVNLSMLVNSMAQLLRVSISRQAALILNTDPLLPLIQADASQLQQIVLNLIVNASEALQDQAGEIRLTTEVRHFDADFLARSRLEKKPPPGNFIALSVTDNGCGMDAATQQRLFEPFFTTKFVGRGLGMSAVLGIVQSHNGAIIIDSEREHGTTVNILFPLETPVEGESSSREATHQNSTALSGAVLVVDDDLPVIEVARRMLSRLGLQVIAATDGPEAIELYQQHAHSIKCVLLDLTMPKMDGVATLKELRAIRDDLPVILSSGFSRYDVESRFAGIELVWFIPKPYMLEDLREVLRKALT